MDNLEKYAEICPTDDYFRRSPAKVLMLMQQMSSRLHRVNREYAEACRDAGK